ncbi:hypothetical protein NKG05_25270 [Oerskovia sp. M15]
MPVSDDPEDGSIRTPDAMTGYVYTSTLEWDAASDSMTDTTTGTVYTPNDDGQFEAEDGTTLAVGWRVAVGLDNFITAFSDGRYAQPFVKILAWTFVFAIGSVVTTFLLGLFLAITFNDTRMRGRKIYRTLMILPYAIRGSSRRCCGRACSTPGSGSSTRSFWAAPRSRGSPTRCSPSSRCSS